jgi:opacity protein-like surface antigen
VGTLAGGDMSTGYTDFTSSKYVAGFIEDDWRVTPKLTLNLGFRYDFTTPYIDRFNHLPRFDPFRPNPIGGDTGPNTSGQTLNQYLTNLGGGPVLGAIVFASSPGVNGREIANTDFTTGVEPRLGVAYAVARNLVFRGGFSKLDFKSPGGSQITLAALPGIAGSMSIVGTIDGIHPAVTTSNPFPGGLLTPTYDSQGLLTDLGEALALGEINDRTPFGWEWNAGFQYSLSKVGVLSVAYAGSRNRQLLCPIGQCGDQVPEADLSKFGSALLGSVPNPFYGIITTPGSLLSQPNVQLGRLLRMNPQYLSWTNYYGALYQGPTSDTFRSAWDALEVGLNAPTWHNLSIMVSYTVSKNLTNADSQTGGYLQPTVGYQNVYNFQGERSLSAMDVPKRLVIGYVYQLPVGHGKRFASSAGPLVNRLIGGWTWGGIVTDASGFPLSISETGHTTGAFAGGDRPNMVGNPCLSSGRSRGDKILQYLNPAAFQSPPNFSFGDAPRLLDCRADGEKNYDMNLSKTTQLTERFGLQLRADAFNLFNRPQLSAPNTVFNSASFGRITSQYNLPRVIQLGLKLVF